MTLSCFLTMKLTCVKPWDNLNLSSLACPFVGHFLTTELLLRHGYLDLEFMSCPGLFSIVVIKHSDRKQLRGGKVCFSLEGSGHKPSRRKAKAETEKLKAILRVALCCIPSDQGTKCTAKKARQEPWRMILASSHKGQHLLS